MNKLIAVVALLLLIGCGKQQEQTKQEPSAVEVNDPNRVLYDQLMEMHDQVMMQSDELYKVKQALLEKAKGQSENQQDIDALVLKLDSASSAMMDWMHHFEMPDSTDEEGTRVYLENEMEKMKRVRDMTNESLEKAKPFLEKK